MNVLPSAASFAEWVTRFCFCWFLRISFDMTCWWGVLRDPVSSESTLPLVRSLIADLEA